MNKNFLALIGLSALFPPKATDTTNPALAKERDDAVAALDKAAKGFDDLEKQVTALTAERDTAKALAETQATEIKALADQLIAAQATAATAEKARADYEASLPALAKAEAARLCAAQGIQLSDLPPGGTGGGTAGNEAELDAAIKTMQAERDPVKKGKLCDIVSALRNKK